MTMAMACDHAPARASMLVFRESTMFIGFQELGEGKTALLGNCRRCKSTVAIEIDVARGSVVHGEIGAGDAYAAAFEGQGGQVDARAVSVFVPRPNACPLKNWCCDPAGHDGDCVMPF